LKTPAAPTGSPEENNTLELGTPYLVKKIIAYFNSKASETKFKYGS
jgi:hypothetical protein